jgi:hypothetical protein
MLLQVLEIIFEVQRKMSNGKNNKKRNKLSNLQNMVFFFFFSLDPSYFQTSWLSYFLYILNDLKCYRSAT